MHSPDLISLNKHFTRRHPDGLTALKINYLIFQFAVGMVSSFGILFVFNLGKDLFSGLTYAVTFFCMQRVVVGLAIPVVAIIISKIGYRRVMLIGLVALAVKLSFLTLVSSDVLWPLVPALIFGGIAIPSYYLAYHALFIDDNDDKKIGEQIGFITMIGGMAGVASPFLAGLIINWFGFSVMFGIVIILILVSILPLMLMKSHQRHAGNYSLSAVWKFLIRNPRVSWSMLVWNFTGAIQVLFWSIFLFLILGSYIKFGIVGSIVVLVNSIAVYLFGKLYDQRQAKKIFLGSSVVVSLTWIARFLSTTPIGATVSDVLNRTFSPPWWMKIRRNELVAGEKVDSLVFGVVHEYLVTFAVVVGWIVGYLILMLTKGQWVWLIIPTVAGTLVSTWILRND